MAARKLTARVGVLPAASISQTATDLLGVTDSASYQFTSGGGSPALRSAPTSPPTNVGVAPGSTLTPSGYFAVYTPNAVIQNMRLSDGIDVRAPGVIIRNCLFDGDSNTGAIHVGDEGSAIIQNCTFTGLGYPVGIAGDNWRAYRVDVYGMGADGFKPGSNCWLVDSYLHDMVSQVAQGTHADALQAQDVVTGLSVVTGNWIDISYDDGTHGSATLFSSPDFDNFPGTPTGWLLFEGNTLGGGGYPIFLNDGSTSRKHKVAANNNKIIDGSYEYAQPILSTGATNTRFLKNNRLVSGAVVPVESFTQGDASISSGQVVFAYTAGGSGTETLGTVPAEYPAGV